MIVLAPASATPADPAPATGRLKYWDRGVPEHGQFVAARATIDGTTQLLSTKAGTKLWMSPNDDLPRVLGEAKAAAAIVGQAVAIVAPAPGHWEQLFVMPLFTVGDGGALQALESVKHLTPSVLQRSERLVAVADVDTAIDITAAPIDDTLRPPRDT